MQNEIVMYTNRYRSTICNLHIYIIFFNDEIRFNRCRRAALLQVHFYTERDVEKIYGAVPKQCLPEDYGGLAQSSEKTHGTHNNIYNCYNFIYSYTI